MLEKDIEGYLRRQVKNRLSGWALKFVSPGLSGVPDRVVLLPGGRVVFVETKAPGKKLRKLQSLVCARIGALGFDVRCIDTREKVEGFIQEMMEKQVENHQVSFEMGAVKGFSREVFDDGQTSRGRA